MGLCASSHVDDKNLQEEHDGDNTSNPAHNPAVTRHDSRRNFMRQDTVTCAASTLRPTIKPHNKKFPMITQTRVDSVDDYYQPCILTETKGKGKRQLVDCAVSDAPEKAILGKGQFGTVVRCQNKEHKYMCALKAIQKTHYPTKYDDAKKKKRFNSTIETLQNEVKQLQKLTGHPSIVALYEVLETSTHLYFATEVRCFFFIKFMYPFLYFSINYLLVNMVLYVLTFYCEIIQIFFNTFFFLFIFQGTSYGKKKKKF